MYSNWRGRQRGYLLADGTWEIIHAGAEESCFCVAPQFLPRPACTNIFDDEDRNFFRSGKWSVRAGGEPKYVKINRRNYQGEVLVNNDH